MKIKSRIKTKVHIDKEYKVVVVVTETNCSLFAVDMINRFENSHFYCTYPELLIKYLIPSRFTGIARCSDADAFSEEEGIKVATRKLYNKIYKSINRQLVAYRRDRLDKVSKDAGHELYAEDHKAQYEDVF